MDLPVDDWHCDVVVTASQKTWMIPPGLAMVSVSKEGWQANASAKMPRFYWDFAQAKSYADRGQTPWTPGMSTMYALNVALDMMLKEGLPNLIARHARIAKFTRDGVKALGLPLFGDEKYASNAVTAVAASNGLDPKKLLRILEEKYDIVLGEGQQKLDGKIFRIAHLGWVAESNIKTVLSGIKTALPEAGFVTTK
jgi:aspartate aminotransferase-like enzyme